MGNGGKRDIREHLLRVIRVSLKEGIELVGVTFFLFLFSVSLSRSPWIISLYTYQTHILGPVSGTLSPSGTNPGRSRGFSPLFAFPSFPLPVPDAC